MDSRIRKAVDLLKARPACKFNISELADIVNLSTRYFSRLFLKETRTSLRQFVREQRLEQARTLLENSFLSVKEIMAVVGINDKSHFAKDFKRVYGLSPIQYRYKYNKSSSDKESSVSIGQQMAKAANT
jgi:transcriptional regulator GlxA family with amidase domain